MIDVTSVVKQLQAEVEQLLSAIKVLSGLDGDVHVRRHRVKRARRKLSAAARARISRAQKARWAAARKLKKVK